MKRLWARISMEMNVSDEEFERLKEQSMNGTFDLALEFDNAELANRFLESGVLSNDSYIPACIFEDGSYIPTASCDD